jgi:hypothetical protein
MTMLGLCLSYAAALWIKIKTWEKNCSADYTAVSIDESEYALSNAMCAFFSS